MHSETLSCILTCSEIQRDSDLYGPLPFSVSTENYGTTRIFDYLTWVWKISSPQIYDDQYQIVINLSDHVPEAVTLTLKSPLVTRKSYYKSKCPNSNIFPRRPSIIDNLTPKSTEMKWESTINPSETVPVKVIVSQNMTFTTDHVIFMKKHEQTWINLTVNISRKLIFRVLALN